MKKIFIISLGIFFYAISYSQDYTPSAKEQLIKHSYYTLSYSEENEQAEWVYYELTPSMINADIIRQDDFRPDPSVSTGSADLNDYKGSGYDRGHLAPAADMKISASAMSESFFMSNMSPQNASFNRGGWKNLESQVREWANVEGRVYIVTGPIFKDNIGTIGANEVTIPGYYFKVVYSPSNKKMIAFKMPNEKIENSLKSYVVTVDFLEYETGIDFFYQLNDELENRLESSTDITAWNFVVTNSTSSGTSKSSTSTQCKGIAKSTGVQCKNKTNDADGYCHYHKNQSPDFVKTETSPANSNSSSVQCKGIAKTTGVQCKNKTTNANGYCSVHKDQAPDYVKPATSNYSGRCNATTKAGSQCKRNAAGGSKYCWQHQ